MPARSVVVCVSIERILAPNTSEQIRALAQMLNERLRQLSQTLGISLPIYILFTKLDNVTPFAEYAAGFRKKKSSFQLVPCSLRFIPTPASTPSRQRR